MNISIGDCVSYEHFPADRLMVIHFHVDTMTWCETFHDWDWVRMRRAIRRNVRDEEQMHLELIELDRLERRLMTKMVSQDIAECERRTRYLWRGVPLLLLGLAAVLFWGLAGLGVVKVLGW